MKYIIGKKQAMTQKFKEDGTVIPVTAVSAGPCFITRVKDTDTDGYKSIQVGYKIAKKLNKPLTGQIGKIFKAKFLKELRIDDVDKVEYKAGQEINVSLFEKGEKVRVRGNSKGKGFQGVVKRHGFKGAPKSHGTKDQLRHPGSIGATGPAHVFKGMKMAGRMGGGQITVTNLEIIDIVPEENLLFVKGAIPGPINGVVEILAPGEMDFSKIKKAEPKKEAEAKEGKEKSVKKDDKPEDKEVKKEDVKVEDKKDDKKEEVSSEATNDKEVKKEDKNVKKDDEKEEKK